MIFITRYREKWNDYTIVSDKNTISMNFWEGIITVINGATLLQQNNIFIQLKFVCCACMKSSIEIDDSIVSHFCT